MNPNSPNRLKLISSAKNAILFGIIVNLFLSLIKGLAGFLGNSYALIADAIESFSDVLGSLVIYTGIRIAAAPPSEKHPYGKGRAETVAALFVAFALFAAAIFIAIYSVEEIRTPHKAPAAFTLIVLALVIVTKAVIASYIDKKGNATHSLALKTDAVHQQSDLLTSLAAFVGISIAILAGPGYESADDWAALFAAVVIAFNAWGLLKPVLSELFDTNQYQQIAADIKEITLDVAGILGTHKCFIRKIGFDHYVDLDILVDGSITVKSGHDLAHKAQDEIRAAFPFISRVLIHVEPITEHGRSPLFEKI